MKLSGLLVSHHPVDALNSASRCSSGGIMDSAVVYFFDADGLGSTATLKGGYRFALIDHRSCSPYSVTAFGLSRSVLIQLEEPRLGHCFRGSRRSAFDGENA